MKAAEPDAIAVLAAKKQILNILSEDKWTAHEILFAHRHQYDGVATPAAEFHEDLCLDFWSDDPYSIRLAFRGSAKSTLGEEDIVLAACLMAHRNIVIISSNETRAAERLAAVAYELINNPWIAAAFGDLKGDAWTQTKLVTTTGVCVQAIGRDQDIRGIKHLDHRPDFIFVDDVESPNSVQTPDQRRKTLRWFLSELLPACAPNRKVRIRATPMDAESLPVKLEKEWGWPCQTYPVEYLGEDGKRRASWPEVWPLSKIDRERQGYERVGELAVWEREMLCRAFSESDRIFSREMIRVAPRERTWQACYAMIDPARTVGSTSATTGWAVWSWISNRLVVWAADAQFLLPDEIVSLSFDIQERYDPVWVGVELDGLEQFLLQPLRHEMVRRGTYLPVRGVRAPRGKLDFIRGLQPFFAARECEFAQPLPALTEQLLNYPTGKIDAPNALAYALQMRPGLPVLEGFGAEHIVSDLEHDPTRPLFLVANATGSMTAAVLCQFHDGRLLLLHDWVREGNPGELVEPIYNESILIADSPREFLLRDRPRSWSAMLKAPVPDRLITRNQPPTWVVPQHHEEKYTNVGLLQAIRQIPADLRLGGAPASGQVQLQDLLGRITRGLPAVAASPRARWICRSLAGGYTRALVRGRLQEFAEEGPYRLLMEGLESFMGLHRKHAQADDEDEDTAQPWAEDRYGNRYRTAMPAQALIYPVPLSAEETTMAQSTSRNDEQQKRLAELRAKPEAQRSAEEKRELERLEGEAGQHQAQRGPGDPAQHQGQSRPLDHPTPGALTAEEQGRLRELNAKRTALTDEETAELDELRVRNTPQSAAQTDRVQRELSPDRPPAPMTDFPRDQANRLRDLRVAADMGRLSDEERSEMGKLSLEESKAAGHAEPVEGKAGPVEDQAIYDILSLVEQIIARTPAFRDLEIIARMLRDRLDTLRNSPEAGPQQRRPGSVTETRPAA